MFVSEIDSKDIKDVKNILESHPIDTDIATWSCQDWVLEALEALHDEEYIDASNYDDVKEKLLENYN